MTLLDPGRLEVASLCDRGRVRTTNQDALGEALAASGARLFVVADGMGGHAGGETASRLAVDAIRAAHERAERPGPDALRAAFVEANGAVHAAAARDEALAGMGTTGVALCFAPDAGVCVANVGDSRAYRLRDGRLEQLTADHSLVAELVRRGMLSEEEARAHPRRNEVLRSLGIGSDVEVDVFEVDAAPGDVFLLCSDGLTGPVRDPEIADALRRHAPAEAARALVELANRRGGPDNVTVQIARVPAAPDEPPTAGGGRPRTAVVAFGAALAALAWWWLAG